MQLLEFISPVVNGQPKGITAVIQLLKDGATVPFIARYRKDQTYGLDEVEIQKIKELQNKFQQIEDRKKTIIAAIEEQEGDFSQILDKVKQSFDLVELEDLYLPFKKTRKTKAEKARQAGLEGLAKIIMSQKSDAINSQAKRFLTSDVLTTDEAIQGAKDIIAEWINENVAFRKTLRRIYTKSAVLESKEIKNHGKDAHKYQLFLDFSQLHYKIPSYRFLALNRAVNEGIVRWKLKVEKEQMTHIVERFFINPSGTKESQNLVNEAFQEAYKRLSHPSLENELLQSLKTKADEEAIQVFSKNLEQLLLAPPLDSKRILAIDPGYRSGCKVVCLDEQGELLTNVNIFPHPPQNELSKAKSKIYQFVELYNIEAIAIGNGTASRETEKMIRTMKFDREIQMMVVSEDGASVYSASAIGRKEFPSYDVTVRGAISIGRRLMDPMAELVKIDPKSIGVGEYQHDVNTKLLQEKLDEVIVSCVNKVGVNLNSASAYLLQYVSGLGPQLAENIVKYRQENGAFTSRSELLNVTRLGQKAFEQCAGFLRIPESDNPLDNTSVHPESYKIVEKIAKQLHLNLKDVIFNEQLLSGLKKEDFSWIEPFLFADICEALKKPARDPRGKLKLFEFDKSVHTMDDLFVGKELPGIVTNVTSFGAFVDIGIKENGLIHKSNLSDHFVEVPSNVIGLHEQVLVKVVEIDKEKKRIGLKRIS